MRFMAGVMILVLFALQSNLRQIKSEIASHPSLNKEDSVTIGLQRFEGLKKLLPEQCEARYLSDKNSMSALYVAQTALAPVVLSGNETTQFVVTDFQNATSSAAIQTNRKWILVMDFGNGVMLFTR